MQRQSDKILGKLERRDKRRGKGIDTGLEWLIANQASVSMLQCKSNGQMRATAAKFLVVLLNDPTLLGCPIDGNAK